MIATHLYETTRELAGQHASIRDAVLAEMSDQELKITYEGLLYDWDLWRRPKQILPPGDYRWCLFACGRGWGKTKTETEILREAAESGEHTYTALVAATSITMKRTLLYGPAGIFTISPPWFRPRLVSADEFLIWPRHPVTGVQMICYLMSGDDPDRIRGSEVSLAILDELTTWNRPDEGFRNIDLTLRHGPNPRGVIGVTPKRTGAGVAFSKDLLFGLRGRDGKRHKREDMVTVHGSTTENVDIAENTVKRWEQTYRGTADELTELEGQLPMEAENALWRQETIDAHRVEFIPSGVHIDRVIVSLDPSRSKTGHRDLCGIITLAKGSDGQVYIFADDSLRADPDTWINRGISVHAFQRADGGIYEANRLGEDNERLIAQRARDAEQRWKPVTARGTKRQRAEPIAAEYKAGRVHHVGFLYELEEEQVGWDPDETKESPNRIDALVHGVKELLLDENSARRPLRVR